MTFDGDLQSKLVGPRGKIVSLAQHPIVFGEGEIGGGIGYGELIHETKPRRVRSAICLGNLKVD